MLYGEAHAKAVLSNTVVEPAIGVAVRNRLGDPLFPGSTTYQNSITAGQFDSIKKSALPPRRPWPMVKGDLGVTLPQPGSLHIKAPLGIMSMDVALQLLFSYSRERLPILPSFKSLDEEQPLRKRLLLSILFLSVGVLRPSIAQVVSRPLALILTSFDERNIWN